MNCTLFGLRRTTFYGGGAGLIHWERWSGLERDEMTMHGWNGACGFSESLFDSFITSPRERTRGGGTAWGRLRRGAPSPAPPLGPPPRPNPREEEDSLSIAAGRDEAYWKLTGRVSASRRCSSVTRHTWIPQPHEPFPSNPPDESHCISTHFVSAKKVRRNVARIILKKRDTHLRLAHVVPVLLRRVALGVHLRLKHNEALRQALRVLTQVCATRR